MNPPKCNELDYINFLVATQQVFSSVEASRTHPAGVVAPAHDAYTRLLQRLPPSSGALWQEVELWVERARGVLVLGDTTLDKPYVEDGVGDAALVAIKQLAWLLTKQSDKLAEYEQFVLTHPG